MKYTEEKITAMLGKDLSDESKIRQSLKLRLLSKNQKNIGRKLFLRLSFSAAVVLLMFALFAAKKYRAQKQYVYGHYPVNSLNLYSDNYGSAGPQGLRYEIYY